MMPEPKSILPSIFQFSLLAIIVALFTFKVHFENDANGNIETPQMSQFQNRRFLLSNPLQDAFKLVHQQRPNNAFASAPVPDEDSSGASERGRGIFRRRRRWRKNLRATVDRLMQSDVNASDVMLPSGVFGLEAGKSLSLPVSLAAPSPTGESQQSFDPAAPMAAIGCVNQTRCIQPQLQLRQHFFVYFCKHVGHGVRFYFLVGPTYLPTPAIHTLTTIHYILTYCKSIHTYIYSMCFTTAHEH